MTLDQNELYQGATDIARLLLERGADVHLRAEYWGTWNSTAYKCDSSALMDAAQNGCTEIVRMLLAAGADANEGDCENRTPLMRASWSGNLEMVTLLLDYGADVNAQAANVDPDYYGGATTLIEAVKGEHIKLAEPGKASESTRFS